MRDELILAMAFCGLPRYRSAPMIPVLYSQEISPGTALLLPSTKYSLVGILQRLVNVRVATLDLMLLLRQLFRPACLFFLHTAVVRVKSTPFYCASNITVRTRPARKPPPPPSFLMAFLGAGAGGLGPPAGAEE